MEQGVRLVLQWIEAVNRGDQAAVQSCLAPDCRVEGAPEIGPGAQLGIEEIFGFGNICILRWSLAEAGSDPGAAGSRGLDLFKLKNGLIAERISYRSIVGSPLS